jgi:hypothetical protein
LRTGSVRNIDLTFYSRTSLPSTVRNKNYLYRYKRRQLHLVNMRLVRFTSFATLIAWAGRDGFRESDRASKIFEISLAVLVAIVYWVTLEVQRARRRAEDDGIERD